ncbi:MAG: DUF255 domain-containing protein [Candidatus Dadabacteria bacterium]|nr:MAG: DUF255 domain-containing protein [Candidatus Dadabacteria bacterium]
MLQGELGTNPAVIQILYAFGVGFLSSLTPCVYPMIPITLSIFGARGDVPTRRSFLLSLSYVVGIATTYTILGLVTAKAGMVFGTFLAKPAVVLAIAVFLFLLALHTLGILNIPLAALQSKAGTVGGKGFGGAFLMGTVSGVVAAPCVGPALVLILVEAARAESTLWGGVLLFSYSIGLGLIFLVLGTFSGLVKKLPGSGNWLLTVKYLIAVAVLVTVFYVLKPLDLTVLEKVSSLSPVLAGILIVITAFLGFITLRRQAASGQLVTATVLAFISFGVLNHRPSSGELEVTWQPGPDKALQVARSSGKAVMIDLYADWCAACRELDRLTFSDPRVVKTLNKEVVPARLDFTRETEKNEELSDRYNVMGLPCVLFVDPDGEEIPDTRLTGFVTPEKFLQHVAKVERILKNSVS